MSKAESDSQNPDTDSMFDFLSEDEGQRARRKASAPDSESPLPIIRKPVPVSESGPLRAPGRGAPVEPPPQLTTPSNPSPGRDDLDFLNEQSNKQPNRPNPVDLSSASPSERADPKGENVTRLRPRFVDIDSESAEPVDQALPHAATPSPVAKARDPRADDDLDFLGLDLNDQPDRGTDWQSAPHADTYRPVGYENRYEEQPKKGRWLLLATVLIVLGIGSFAFTTSPEWFTTLSDRLLGKETIATLEPVNSSTDIAGNSGVPPIQTGASPSGLNNPDFPATQSLPDPLPVADVATANQNIDVATATQNIDVATAAQNVDVATAAQNTVQSPLMQRFRQELERVENLVQTGALDDAEQAIATMDRTVYGYGAFEFSELEARIQAIKSGEVALSPASTSQTIETQLEDTASAELARLADEERLAEAARLEQQRLAEEARLAEAAQVEQQRLVEEFRLAEAAQVEQQRLVEEARLAEAAQVEQQRLAEEARLAEATRVEQQRLAEEARLAEAARVEQQRLAEEARLAEATRVEQQRLADAARAEQNRLAEEARLADADRVEQNRLAEEARLAAAVRVEQNRLAEEARLAEAAQQSSDQTQLSVAQQRLAIEAQLTQAARLAELQQNASAPTDRDATDRRIAEERAAIQRQQARESRLEQSREQVTESDSARDVELARQAQAQKAAEDRAIAKARAAAEAKAVAESRAAAEARAAAKLAALDTAPESNNGPAETAAVDATPTIQTITDEELQLVYRRFSNLKTAIEERDINAVVSLTQRSGIRVQQVMQLFENSVEIDTRIRNVSTRNASGEIGGVLQIRSIRRADGTVTQAPASLASITLTSKRDASGWSAIRW